MQWDTQMGEESFGSAEHMNGEQLDGREKHFNDEIAKLAKERESRPKCWEKFKAADTDGSGDVDYEELRSSPP